MQAIRSSASNLLGSARRNRQGSAQNDVEMQNTTAESANPSAAAPPTVVVVNDPSSSTSAQQYPPPTTEPPSANANTAADSATNSAAAATAADGTSTPRTSNRLAARRQAILRTLNQHISELRDRERTIALTPMEIAQLRSIEATTGLNFADMNDEFAGIVLAMSGPRSAVRRDARNKKDREEASTLIGPSLAQYFGNGSSSSGAVVGGATAASATAPASNPNIASTTTQPTAGPSGTAPATPAGISAAVSPTEELAPTSPTTPGTLGALARRARLGSRGRARGASLSGLSTALAFNGPQDGDIPESPAFFAGRDLATPGDGLATATKTPGPDDQLAAMTEAVAASEGIDVEILQRWIERSLDISGAKEVEATIRDNQVEEDKVQKALSTMTTCTTLQSMVNLKRNTVHLMSQTTDTGLQASAGPSEPDSHPLINPPTVVSLADLPPAKSLGSLPTFASISGSGASQPLAGPTTHQLHFEYDCSAPMASVQIFIRASRKHGSWSSWVQRREEGGLPVASDGAEESLYCKRGPPPHVLGWPVHSSRVKRGFSSPIKAGLSLQLQLYAPPKSSAAKKEEAAAGNVNGTAPQVVDGKGAASSSNKANAEGVKKESDGDTTGIPTQSTALATSTSEPPALAAIPENETREQRLAREKTERETLKLAIVVEALDEFGRPYPEPNLQTSYIRLTSLPIRAPVTAPQAPVAPLAESQTAAADAAGVESSRADHGADAQELSPVDAHVASDSVASKAADTPAVSVGTTTPVPKTNPRIWQAHVEGQEAEIGPHRFQLQELYGLSTRPPPVSVQQEQLEAAGASVEADNPSSDPTDPADPSDPADPNSSGPADAETSVDLLSNMMMFSTTEALESSECQICLSSSVTTLLLPCTHGMCLACSVQLKNSVKNARDGDRRRGKVPRKKYNCPMCRRGFTSMLHLSMQPDAAANTANAATTAGGPAAVVEENVADREKVES